MIQSDTMDTGGGDDASQTGGHAGELLSPGELVDHFSVIRLLGRGGMSAVYLARDTKLGRKVALKFLLPKDAGEKEAVERFAVEAELTARFSHPHIVTIYAVDEHKGVPFVALEYLEGQTLRGRFLEQPLSVGESMRHGLAIAEALVEAHRHGVLHLDLKPENVVIPMDGRLRVVDFGLARALRSVEEDSPGASTKRGRNQEMMITGTPLYMAPEQWTRDELTEATDVWALGVILYELLTGSMPFRGNTLTALFSSVIEDEAPELESADGTPPELAKLVSRCLHKKPDERPPSTEVVSVLKDLLRSKRARSPGEVSPFRGLLPFTEEHSDLFFGRDAEVDAFLERLRHQPTLPVVGPSGAGKSSFVQAGVLPRLHEQGRWLIVRLRPGTQPFQHLLYALRSPSQADTRRYHIDIDAKTIKDEAPPYVDTARGEPKEERSNEPDEETLLAEQLIESPGILSVYLQRLAEREQARVLLFVDQLEELYTLTHDSAIRRRFLDAICTAADDHQGPVRMVFTLRDDFLGRVAETSSAREVLRHITVLRSPDSRSLREILTKPLEHVGYRYDDPTLPDELVSAVRGEVASLPLLQFVCARLWETRDKHHKELRREDYTAIGGVEGALAHHADDVLDGMTSQQAGLARHLLLRLVTAEGTRKVVERSRLIEGLNGDAEDVLDRLIQGRTVLTRKGSAGEAEIELVHESLITGWHRLRRWLEESREEVAFLAEAQQAAELWERRGRSAHEVWRGSALQEALARARRCTAVPTLVAEFLESGRRTEQRRIRRTRRIVGAVIVTLVLLSGVLSFLSITAFNARNRERESREVAEDRRAEALYEGAQTAFEQGDIVEARAKLLASMETADSQAARVLWQSIDSISLHAKSHLPTSARSIDFSPDGRSLVAAGLDGSLYLMDVSTLRVREVLRMTSTALVAVAFSREGSKLATGDVEGRVRLWHIAVGRTHVVGQHDGSVQGLAFSPDDALLASGSADATIKLWDVASGREVRVLEGHESNVNRVAFAPDGRTIASASRDKTVRIWEVSTGRTVNVLRGHEGWVTGVTFSPDGHLIASTSYDRTTRVWDAKTGEQRDILRNDSRPGRNVVFSNDGRFVFGSGNDGTVDVWEISSKRLVGVLESNDVFVFDTRLSSDGQLLATTADGGTVGLWDVERSLQSETRHAGHHDRVWSARFSPDGRIIASCGVDKTVRLWNIADGTVDRVLRGHHDVVMGLSFSPDSKVLASASWDKTIRLWDIAKRFHGKVLGGHSDMVTDVDFNPDGRVLAAAINDGAIWLRDVTTGNLLEVLEGHEFGPNQVDFDHDGHLLVSGGDDSTVRIWDASSGEQVKMLKVPSGTIGGVSFSPDGSRLVTSGGDGTVQVWDVQTGSGRLVDRCPQGGWHAAFHPDNQRIGASCVDGTAFIVGITTGEKTILTGHGNKVNDVSFSPDGRWFVTTGDDFSVRLWEAESGRPVWRAPVLLSAPPRVFTHRGWKRLDDGGAASPNEAAPWRSVIEDEARLGSQSSDGKLLCIRTHDDRVHAWNIATGKRLFSDVFPGVQDIGATPSGCVARCRDGEVRRYSSSGEHETLSREASAIAVGQTDILIAESSGGIIFDIAGHKRGVFEIEPGVTALATVGDRIAVGYREGSIDLISRDASHEQSSIGLEDLPSSAVVRIVQGLGATLAAGYGNGQVGLWDLELGTCLYREQLNGPVVHLLFEANVLYIASELGDVRALDLNVLDRPYCELLREIWNSRSVIWEKGRAVERGPPAAGEHLCAP